MYLSPHPCDSKLTVRLALGSMSWVADEGGHAPSLSGFMLAGAILVYAAEEMFIYLVVAQGRDAGNFCSCDFIFDLGGLVLPSMMNCNDFE